METGKFKHYLRSITYYLLQIHESQRETIIKKIRLAISLSEDPVSGIPTLEEAFRHYGKAIYRVWLVKETNHLLMQAWGRFNFVEPWAYETREMHEQAKRLEVLWKEMIDTLIYHQTHPQ